MNNFIPAESLLQNAMLSDDHPLDEPTHSPSAEGLGAKETVLFEQVKEALRDIYDPEIPVNIYELGLIYDIAVNHLGEVYIRMTLTSPACPVAGTLPGEIEAKVEGLDEVTECTAEVVWEPTYSMNMMSESARLQLGLL